MAMRRRDRGAARGRRVWSPRASPTAWSPAAGRVSVGDFWADTGPAPSPRAPWPWPQPWLWPWRPSWRRSCSSISVRRRPHRWMRRRVEARPRRRPFLPPSRPRN